MYPLIFGAAKQGYTWTARRTSDFLTELRREVCRG
ncbi:hypothetical protein B2K_38670 [Paenibacillus mucilaginosus K02]|uniref:Uncharacterized protein n=1 Tax=Paenibacillus mucilaginosus K02 TaxID=997761 RepID=R9UL88_9BACL|nr:hypothetical protein B2K_38670 [Paenibacillus mucilaginosus K02]